MDTAGSLKLDVFLNGEWKPPTRGELPDLLDYDGVPWIYPFIDTLADIRSEREQLLEAPVGRITIDITNEQHGNLYRAFNYYRKLEDWYFEPVGERIQVGRNSQVYRFKWPAALELEVIWYGD